MIQQQTPKTTTPSLLDLATLPLLAAAIALLLPMPAFSAPPTVEVSEVAVSVKGLPPRSVVALIGAAHEPSYYMTRVVSTRELLADADGDGVVRYEPKNGVAFRSIWVAVEVATGNAAVGSRAGFQPLEMNWQAATFGEAVEKIGDKINVSRDHVNVLVVRRGVGAWAVSARDGGTVDRDGSPNRTLQLDVSKLRPLGSNYGIAPPALIPDDVVAILDPERMEYWLSTNAQGVN